MPQDISYSLPSASSGSGIGGASQTQRFSVGHGYSQAGLGSGEAGSVLTASGSIPTGSGTSDLEKRKRKLTRKERNLSRRPILQALLRKGMDIADDACEHAEDVVHKVAALTSLQSIVDDIWEERHHHERELAMVINQIRCMLATADLEKTNVEQLQSLWAVFNMMYDLPIVSTTTHNSCLERLEQGGWDLYQELM